MDFGLFKDSWNHFSQKKICKKSSIWRDNVYTFFNFTAQWCTYLFVYINLTSQLFVYTSCLHFFQSFYFLVKRIQTLSSSYSTYQGRFQSQKYFCSTYDWRSIGWLIFLLWIFATSQTTIKVNKQLKKKKNQL